MYYSQYSDSIYCKKSNCNELIPSENIDWDSTFDYDGNDRIHTYGRYRCPFCGDDSSFPTNDPYENDDE